MSLLPALVLPDALRSPDQGCIRPDCPLVGSRTAPRRRTLLPFFFFFPFVGNLSLHNLRPLLTFILFPPRCALCHCLFLSRPAPLSFPLTHVDYLSLFYRSLFLVHCLFLPLVNSSFSKLSPLSAHSLYLSHVLSLHLNCHSSSFPPLFLRHYLLLQLRHTLFSFGSACCLSLDEHCVFPPSLSFPFVSPSLSLHLHTVPSVFAKH